MYYFPNSLMQEYDAVTRRKRTLMLFSTLVSTNIRIAKSLQIGYTGRADTWAAPSAVAASAPEAEDIHPGLTAPAAATRIRIIRNTRGLLRPSSMKKPGNRSSAQFRSKDDSRSHP